MIVSVLLRRLKEGCSFDDFVQAWEADQGFGVPTRVFNAVGLDDPREVISIGFVKVDADGLANGLTASEAPEAVRHQRIDEVVESTRLRCMYELRTEHDFTRDPRAVDVGSAESMLHALR
jgi:hypothetical protein